MNNKNEQQLKSDTLRMWSTWGKKGQSLILFSALAAASVEPLSAQSTEIPNGTTVTTTTAAADEIIEVAADSVITVADATAVALTEDTTTLNNVGSIATTGVTSTVSSTAIGSTINNTGELTADSRVVDIAGGSGLEVNNTGTITGTGDQRNGTVYADSTAQDFTLNNDGVIDAGEDNLGAGFSSELSAEGNNFDINNTGTIQGRGADDAGFATAGDGIRFERERVSGVLDATTTGLFTGNISNSGLIDSESNAGTTAGIRFVNGVSFNGTIENQEGGVISGEQNGLYFGNATAAGGGDFTDAVVNNAGTISSASRALNIDGTGLEVNNTGTITGTGDQRNGTVYFDSTANNATLNNQVGGVIDAGEGNQGSGVSIQSGDGDRNQTITNNGSILGRGDAPTSGAAAGIRVSGTAASIADIDITNGSTGSISSETSAGILLEGITSTGSIVNSGDITGTTAAIDTTTAVGDIVIDQLDGSLNGGVLTGTGDDTLNISGDSTITGLIDLGAGTNSVNVLAGRVATIDGQTIDNSDLNVEGTLGLNLDTPLAVNGVTTFEAGSTIAVNVEDITAVDLADSTTILTSDSIVGGTNVVIEDSSLLLDFELAEQPLDTVQVQASNADLTQAFDDTNVTSFAQALQADLSLNTDATVTDIISQLDASDAAGFEASSAQLLPDLSSGVTRELYENQSSTFNSIERQLAQANESDSFWFEASGRSAERDGGSSVTDNGYDSDSAAFILGYGKSITSRLSVGAAISYSDIEVDAGFTNTDIEAFSFNLYGQYAKDDFFVRGGLGYSFGDAEASRNSNFGDIDSDFNLDQFAAKVSVGVDKTIANHKFSPFASLQFANTSRDSFTEDGGLGLSVSDDSTNIFELGVGVSHEVGFKLGATPVKLVSRFGYYYDVLDESTSATARLATGSQFNLDSASISQSSFEFATGLDFGLSESSTISVGYEGNYASDFDSHTGYLRFKKEF